MLDLPPELYYEIALQSGQSEPVDIYNIQSWAYRHDSLEYYRACSQTRPFAGEPDVETLRNLRLTSRAFNQAASSVLFRCIRIQWRPIKGVSPSAFNDKIDRHLSGTTATLAPFVKELQIGFRRWEAWKGFLLHPDPVRAIKEIPRRLIDRIPDILARMSQLESLQIVLPGWKSDYDGGGEGTDFAPDLDLSLLTNLRTHISLALSENSFSYLTELRLYLPCTYDFVEVSKSVPDSLFNQLKTLFLAITDATGPGGSKDYLS
ncbi:hypothetical protein BDZ45DRAFT_742331 [Acephala macrosclerotiorum]|nr:hypothetical protein BDZ45DRAFT_742331 [Acephala macrosclerotiorum]